MNFLFRLRFYRYWVIKDCFPFRCHKPKLHVISLRHWLFHQDNSSKFFIVYLPIWYWQRESESLNRWFRSFSQEETLFFEVETMQNRDTLAWIMIYCILMSLVVVEDRLRRVWRSGWDASNSFESFCLSCEQSWHCKHPETLTKFVPRLKEAVHKWCHVVMGAITTE